MSRIKDIGTCGKACVQSLHVSGVIYSWHPVTTAKGRFWFSDGDELVAEVPFPQCIIGRGRSVDLRPLVHTAVAFGLPVAKAPC